MTNIPNSKPLLVKMSREMAKYIADYVMEEVERGEREIDDNVILDAIDAYEGGAR